MAAISQVETKATAAQATSPRKTPVHVSVQPICEKLTCTMCPDTVIMNSGETATAALQMIHSMEKEMALAAPNAVGFSFMSCSFMETSIANYAATTVFRLNNSDESPHSSPFIA